MKKIAILLVTLASFGLAFSVSATQYVNNKHHVVVVEKDKTVKHVKKGKDVKQVKVVKHKHPHNHHHKHCKYNH